MERLVSARFGSRRALAFAACLGLAVVSACAGRSIQNADDEGNCESCGASGGSSGRGGSGGAGGTAGTIVFGGSSGSATGGVSGDAGFAPVCDGAGDSVRLRRLTAGDIHRTLDHALGEGATMESSWPEHRLGPRGTVTEDEARAFVTMARARAQAYAQTDLGCDLGDEMCVSAEIDRVARRLLRRPLTSGEQLDLAALYDSNAGGTAQSRFAAVVETLIESPYFVFRVELGNGTGPANAQTPLTAYELATRLAYFLWRSGPDDALLDAADRNLLGSPEGIEAETQRMLADPRAVYGQTELTREWLELVGFDAIGAAVGLSDELRADMREQTELFLRRIFEGAPNLDELLLASVHPINPALAEHYDAGTFRLVGFDDYRLDPDRFSGILTHGSLLASLPSISGRGAFVRRALFCDEVPFPPSTKPIPAPENATNRAWFEAEVGSVEGCAGCHLLLDPIGYAFGGFDQQARAQEQPLDGIILDLATGFEQPFTGPRGLAEALVASPKVSGCTARHWLEYALDREAGEPVLMIPPSGGGDAPIGPGGDRRAPTALECISNAFYNSGRSFTALALGIAKSAPFRTITGAEPGRSPPGTGPSAKALDHAIAETSNLRSLYGSEAPLIELEAYLAALQAIAGDETGTGGAGGAGP